MVSFASMRFVGAFARLPGCVSDRGLSGIAGRPTNGIDGGRFSRGVFFGQVRARSAAAAAGWVAGGKQQANAQKQDQNSSSHMDIQQLLGLSASFFGVFVAQIQQKL